MSNVIHLAERRATSLQDEVRLRLRRVDSLPVLPAAAAELVAMVGRDDTDAKQLSDVVHRDPTVAAHVLRVANAPSYRGVSTIVSLQQAIARLGIRLLTEIALSVTMGSLFDVGGQAKIAERLWQRALATGLVAKEVARTMRCNVESAFLCGLLHDVGSPVVLGAIVDTCKQRRQKPPEGAVEQLLDVHTPVVGMRLAERWHLPAKVAAVIASHRRPEIAGAHRTDAAVVGLSRMIAELFLGLEESVTTVTQSPLLEELNLYPDEVEALLGRQDAIDEAMKAVRA